MCICVYMCMCAYIYIYIYICIYTYLHICTLYCTIPYYGAKARRTLWLSSINIALYQLISTSPNINIS